jgi:PAS domain S-box-containing protein
MNSLNSMTHSPFEYERFFDLTPDLLCIAGYDGYFKKVNKAVCRVLGYSFEELYSRPINDFIYFEDQKMTSEFRNEIINSTPLLDFENRYVHKSGEIVWLSWTSQPIEDKQLVFAIAKDITHKKHLENERNLLLEKTSRRNQDLKQFSFTASHDLRSPVNNLMSIMELLHTIPNQDNEIIELHDILKNAITNLRITLDNHVDILKETQSSIVQKEKINLKTTLEKVCQSISSLIIKSKSEINSDFTAFAEVRFNQANLESIFLNLISNSIKYARPGIAPLIKFSTRIKGNKRQLCVEDNGLGFDAENLGDKIFGISEQSNDNPNSKGVGLYLVYNHVINMGGKIEVESKINQGTNFIITFKIQ